MSELIIIIRWRSGLFSDGEQKKKKRRTHDAGSSDYMSSSMLLLLFSHLMHVWTTWNKIILRWETKRVQIDIARCWHRHRGRQHDTDRRETNTHTEENVLSAGSRGSSGWSLAGDAQNVYGVQTTDTDDDDGERYAYVWMRNEKS